MPAKEFSVAGLLDITCKGDDGGDCFVQLEAIFKDYAIDEATVGSGVARRAGKLQSMASRSQ
jgi:hypothetical protein